MPIVMKPNGRTVDVKNLGWLLKHRNDGVVCVQVIPYKKYGAFMSVQLLDGTKFFNFWQSYSVCVEWVGKYLEKYCDNIIIKEGSVDV